MSPNDENMPPNSNLDPTDHENPNNFWPLANFIYFRAEDLIRNNKISFNQKMHIFNVQETKEVRVHVVKLHSKENCSYSATGIFYYILGVKLSLGLKVSTSITSERSLAKLCKAGNNHNLMMYVLTQIRITIAAYPNKERSLKCVIVKVSNHAKFSGV